MFCLETYTARHSPPDMADVFEKLAKHMEEHSTNIDLSAVKKRKSGYEILDMINEGMDNMGMSDDSSVAYNEFEDEGDGGIESADLEDDGSLEA